MNKYTVILEYPEYMFDRVLTHGSYTYMTTVDALTVQGAIEKARKEIMTKDEDEDPDDFEVIAVIAGEHQDIKDQA
jgi:hypothetical protein